MNRAPLFLVLSLLASAAYPDGSERLSYPVLVTPPFEEIRTVIPVSDFTLRPAPASQNQPAIASGGGVALAVWSDHRYGNYDVFATRIAPDGTALDRQGLPITPSWADDLDPDVTWNGASFLIVWANAIGIFGAELHTDASGSALGKLVETPQYSAAHTAVEWNGRSYLVLWTETTGTLNGIVLDAEKRPASNRFLVATGKVARPEIATDGESFMAVWEEGDTVRSARIDATGVVSPVRTLGTTPPLLPRIPGHYTTGAFPDVRFGHGEYLAVWSDGKARAQRLSRDGDLLGETETLSAEGKITTTPAAEPLPNGWMVLWASSPPFPILGPDAGQIFEELGGFDLEAIELDLELHPLVPSAIVMAASGMQLDPVLISSSDRILAAWVDGRSSAPPGQYYSMRFVGDLYVGMLDSSGKLATEAAIAALGVPNHEFPTLAASNGIILVLWREQLDDDSFALVWRRFDSSGMPLDSAPSFLPTDPRSYQRRIGVAASNEGFLIAWDELRANAEAVRAVRLGIDGVLLDREPIQVTDDGSDPSVASDGLNFLVAWSRRTDRVSSIYWQERETRATLVTGRGLPSNADGMVLSSDPVGSEGYPAVAWTGGRYFVAWSINLGPPWFPSGVRARFVSVVGTPLDAQSIRVFEPQKYGPSITSIASSGTEHVILGGALRAFSVSNEGVVTTGNFTGIGRLFPRGWITFDGQSYVNGPAPMAALEPGLVALAGSQLVPMLPSAHSGGVRRVSLRIHRTGRTRPVRVQQ